MRAGKLGCCNRDGRCTLSSIVGACGAEGSRFTSRAIVNGANTSVSWASGPTGFEVLKITNLGLSQQMILNAPGMMLACFAWHHTLALVTLMSFLHCRCSH